MDALAARAPTRSRRVPAPGAGVGRLAGARDPPPTFWEHLLLVSALLRDGHPEEVARAALPVLLPAACSLLRFGGQWGWAYPRRDEHLAWTERADAHRRMTARGRVLMLDPAALRSMRDLVWREPTLAAWLSSWSCRTDWAREVDEGIELWRATPEGARADAHTVFRLRAAVLERCC